MLPTRFSLPPGSQSFPARSVPRPPAPAAPGAAAQPLLLERRPLASRTLPSVWFSASLGLLSSSDFPFTLPFKKCIFFILHVMFSFAVCLPPLFIVYLRTLPDLCPDPSSFSAHVSPVSPGSFQLLSSSVPPTPLPVSITRTHPEFSRF